MTTSKDLFDDSTMTFGEHLEVLRVHLIKAIIGLSIAVDRKSTRLNSSH